MKGRPPALLFLMPEVPSWLEGRVATSLTKTSPHEGVQAGGHRAGVPLSQPIAAATTLGCSGAKSPLRVEGEGWKVRHKYTLRDKTGDVD